MRICKDTKQETDDKAVMGEGGRSSQQRAVKPVWRYIVMASIEFYFAGHVWVYSFSVTFDLLLVTRCFLVQGTQFIHPCADSRLYKVCIEEMNGLRRAVRRLCVCVHCLDLSSCNLTFVCSSNLYAHLSSQARAETKLVFNRVPLLEWESLLLLMEITNKKNVKTLLKAR